MLLKLGYFSNIQLGSGNGNCFLGQEVTLAQCQRQSAGCSCIPWEGTWGFPCEDGEAVLRGFVFLFRPPGLATATDGDRLGSEWLLVLESLRRCENAHPERYLPSPGCSSLHGGGRLTGNKEPYCYHDTGLPNAPVVEGAWCLTVPYVSSIELSA